MLLPIRTAPEDIEAICGYLLTKPAGASPSDVANNKSLDRRKVAALKFWGLIEDAAGKLILSPRGRLVTTDRGAQLFRRVNAHDGLGTGPKRHRRNGGQGGTR